MHSKNRYNGRCNAVNDSSASKIERQYVMVPIDEYRVLCLESVCNTILRRVLSAETSNYVDGCILKTILGIQSIGEE